MKASTLTASLACLALSSATALTGSHSPKSPKVPATVNGKPTTSGWKTRNQPKVGILGEDSFTITTPPATDLWRPDPMPKSDNFTAPYVYRSIKASEFHNISVTVSADWTTRYDQGGIAIIFPEKKPLKWVKSGIEVETGSPQFGTVGTYAFSDWSLSPVTPANATTARFLLERDGSEMWVYVLNLEDPTAERYPLREVTWAFLEDRADDDVELWVGVYAAKPTYNAANMTQDLEVTFKDLVIC
jgi:regulation of enolase protein 1 (concanavalin A-like superfamily)